MDEKTIYRNLCAENEEIPLFMRFGWMQAACGDAWRVFFYDTLEAPRAIWVCHLRRQWGTYFLIPPPLTPCGGLWVLDNRLSSRELSAWVQAVLREIHPLLVEQAMSPAMQGRLVLPGMQERITYRLPLNQPAERLLQGFHTSKRRQVEKALRAGLRVTEHVTVEQLYALLQQRHGKVLYTLSFLQGLVEYASSVGQAVLLGIEDVAGHLHAATFTVYDLHCAYYLVYGVHPAYASSGASSLLVYALLQCLYGKTALFDFEGSMSPSIATSYRRFGSQAVPYPYYRQAMPGVDSLLGVYRWLRHYV